MAWTSAGSAALLVLLLVEVHPALAASAKPRTLASSNVSVLAVSLSLMTLSLVRQITQ
jgi:hypothetical protein